MMNPRLRAELVQQQLVVKLAQENGRTEALAWLQEKHGVTAQVAEELVAEGEQLLRAQVRREALRGMRYTAPVLLVAGGSVAWLPHQGPASVLGLIAWVVLSLVGVFFLAQVVSAWSGKKMETSFGLTGGGE